MKTLERVRAIGTHLPNPDHISLVILTFLAAFSLGIIPVIYGFQGLWTMETDIYPTEAQLWRMGK